MNSKLKLSVLAGALALAVAGQANAAIVAGGTYANDLVLSVWDQTNNTSYTANLGVTMQNFLTGAGVTAGGTAKAPVLTGTDTAANDFSFSDAALSSFLSTASANTTWSVIGVNMGVVAYGTNGVMTTSTSPITAPNVSAANLAAMQSANGNYIATVNSLMAPSAVSISTTQATGGLAYVGGFGNGMGNNIGGNLYVLDTASLGQSQNFFFMTPTQNSRGAYAGSAVYQFADAAGASTFTLGTNGTLSYSVASVAAVPEPGEWALMLSGFGLIGFIAARRKGTSSMTFA